jgi:hypothetical protein
VNVCINKPLEPIAASYCPLFSARDRPLFRELSMPPKKAAGYPAHPPRS